ncbi:hypothetical protein TrRE_jg10278 [Triparma retinervis]|uniref:NADH:ubiquinone reductase (non-electrogenic) n=1 Tax=Triparma retinervis TaxID=2557542 RepID=A0A9W7G4Z9_9STRA|nr:hypothetical protein TrRE_jg10278 [Triparma retinervis]
MAPFDKSLQAAAIDSLTRKTTSDGELTELLLDSGVKEVKSDVILLNDGREIPYGLSVWAAGNGPMPLTLSLIESIGGGQKEAQAVARGRLAIDGYMRVVGTDGSLLALGDCSCITENQLPATAQVASQQGEFLAKLFSRIYDLKGGSDGTVGVDLMPPKATREQDSLAERVAAFATGDTGLAVPFQFLNLGILAYIGAGSALAQVQLTPNPDSKIKGSGPVGFGIWRSVYLSKQISTRNRFLVLVDWLKAKSFGRDITRL